MLFRSSNLLLPKTLLSRIALFTISSRFLHKWSSPKVYFEKSAEGNPSLIPVSNIKTIFIINEDFMYIWGDPKHYDATFIIFREDITIMQEEFKKQITSAFLQNVTSLHIYIVVHGNYNKNKVFSLFEDNNTKGLPWTIFQRCFLKYFNTLPMFLVILTCGSLNMGDIIFKLQPNSKVITIADWFNITRVSVIMFILYKHPLVFIQTALIINPNITIHHTVAVISYKNEKQLVNYDYFYNYSVTNFVFPVVDENPYTKYFLLEKDMLSTRFMKCLDTITSTTNPQEQTILKLSANKEIKKFYQKHHRFITWSINKLIPDIPDLSLCYGIWRAASGVDSYIVWVFKNSRCNFTDYEDINSLMQKFKKRFENKIGAHNYTWTRECLFQYDSAFIKTYQELINPHVLNILHEICSSEPTIHEGDMEELDINSIYHLFSVLVKVFRYKCTI